MNDEQLLRYSRHILLADFDYSGQQRLVDAKVLIVGLGGLGCPVALYLAAAGVGHLSLADFDTVDFSNLQRQIAHGEADVGRLKVDSVADSIAALNLDVQISKITDRQQRDQWLDTMAQVDVVIDASDNFTTRFDLNRACVTLGKPLVTGAAMHSEGQIAVFDRRHANSPCYQCWLPTNHTNNQANCSTRGVLSPLVGIIGSIQALETIKLLSHFGEPLHARLLTCHAKTMQWQCLRIKKDPLCTVCGVQ